MSGRVNGAALLGKRLKAQGIVAKMSLAEKAAFLSGKSFWNLKSCERLGVPSAMVTDGPQGLRKQIASGDHIGSNSSVPATCFPAACALAASWDPDLLRDVGVALGEQCRAEDVAVLLAPGINIKRHPLCGRNFEYFSEDPLLSGELAAACIDGIQSQGVGASIKHLAANNQESGRMVVDAVVDERTLREIYLRGFEIAVKRAQPWTVMCAYNRLNGTYCSEHEWLLNSVLRDEWGFEGLVMTDWGATNDRARGLAAGLDLEMPYSGGANDALVLDAVRNGRLSEIVLDRAVVRIVSLALLAGEASRRKKPVDYHVHHALAKRAAIESAVLLKNEKALLPLSPSGRVAVIGAFAKKPRYQGTGSSRVSPTRLECAFDAILNLADNRAEVVYSEGYDPVVSEENGGLIQSAAETARRADVAIVFAGLPPTSESEGFDRSHMRMPEQHNRLIEAVAHANPNTVVVLSNGAPVEMPWIDQLPAVLECYLAGQAGGSAAAELLFGLATPSGKLAETFPYLRQDSSSDPWFPGEGRKVQYREGLYVGYRYFDSARSPVRFPFGHGLSYTKFDYADLEVLAEGDAFFVSLTISNSGAYAGAEVVQLYTHYESSAAYRPLQELKAYAKVRLEPGQFQKVHLTLDREVLAIFDRGAGQWIVEAGRVEIRVGASSRDIRLTAVVEVKSSQVLSAVARISGPTIGQEGLTVSDAAFEAMLGRVPPAPDSIRPFTLNSTLGEIRDTWMGRLASIWLAWKLKKNLDIKDDEDATLRMVDEMTMTMPLRTFSLFGQGKPSIRCMQVLVALLNGRIWRMLRTGFSREQAWE